MNFLNTKSYFFLIFFLLKVSLKGKLKACNNGFFLCFKSYNLHIQLKLIFQKKCSNKTQFSENHVSVLQRSIVIQALQETFTVVCFHWFLSNKIITDSLQFGNNVFSRQEQKPFIFSDCHKWVVCTQLLQIARKFIWNSW